MTAIWPIPSIRGPSVDMAACNYSRSAPPARKPPAPSGSIAPSLASGPGAITLWPVHCIGHRGMKLVIFGLTITSSWGNGHATLWRGLVRALGARGHHVVFFERDVPYYAMHRDLTAIAGHDIQLYDSWDAVREAAARHVRDADVAMVTSYCPDAAGASDLVLGSAAPVRAFYDLDTPVTLSRLENGARVEYLPPQGLGAFDLVLSYTGGGALTALRDRLGARLVRPLYGSVDPAVHRPTASRPAFDADLSYLGTYAEDRQRRSRPCSSSRRGDGRICGSSSAGRCTRNRSRGRRTSTT